MNSNQPPMSDLQDAKLVAFDKIHLDPNNPRIASENPPGYLDDKALFAEDTQQKLENRVRAVYDVANLEDSILAHGWVPIDSILVWEHSHRPGHYIVVEGNTRTVALRALRGSRLERERKKLEKLKKTPTRFEEELRLQQNIVDRLETIASQTDQLRVFPVAAKSVDELQAILPRLLGVRHISHAREWKWGLACCSLHLITTFSPSRSARALHAGVLRPSANPDCCAAPCLSRSRAIPP